MTTKAPVLTCAGCQERTSRNILKNAQPNWNDGNNLPVSKFAPCCPLPMCTWNLLPDWTSPSSKDGSENWAWSASWFGESTIAEGFAATARRCPYPFVGTWSHDCHTASRISIFASIWLTPTLTFYSHNKVCFLLLTTNNNSLLARFAVGALSSFGSVCVVHILSHSLVWNVSRLNPIKIQLQKIIC